MLRIFPNQTLKKPEFWFICIKIISDYETVSYLILDKIPLPEYEIHKF